MLDSSTIASGNSISLFANRAISSSCECMSVSIRKNNSSGTLTVQKSFAQFKAWEDRMICVSDALNELMNE